jgi:hypothetical protein
MDLLVEISYVLSLGPAVEDLGLATVHLAYADDELLDVCTANIWQPPLFQKVQVVHVDKPASEIV